MRIVPINSVSSGVQLGQNIHSVNGDILLKRGVVLTDQLLTRIRNNDIYTIYIDEGYTDEMIEDIIRPEVRQKAIQAIKETFKQVDSFSRDNLDDSPDLKKRLQAKGMEKYMLKLKNICDCIVDDISHTQHLMVNLVDIKNLSNHQYEHALSVAILSTVIGIEMKIDRHQLYNLFLGAILHDIGKLFISKELLTQKTPFTLEQLNQIRQHTQLGYHYLKENYHFEAPTRIVALQHHECWNGTGYPKGTSGENLHLFSRIVAVCNTYDNLVSDKPLSPAVSAHEAIEFIMGNAGQCFDFKIVEVFTRKINPYPVGTVVHLSNGLYAVVMKETPNFPLRPLVQVVDPILKKLLTAQYDLMIIKDLTILGVLK